MQRREFIGLLGGAATAWPLSAKAQQVRSRRLPTVGFVGFASPAFDDQTILPFRQALSALGYTEGQSIAIEVRNAQGDAVRARP